MSCGPAAPQGCAGPLRVRTHATRAPKPARSITWAGPSTVTGVRIPSRRIQSVLLALLVVVGLAGCEATAQVNVDVAKDGSGTVAVVLELDREALGRVGGLKAIDTSDLAAAGWDVAEPELIEGGTVKLRVEKDYGRPSDLQPTLEEITGPNGPLQGLRVDVLDKFGGTKYVLDGRLVTEVNLAQFSDQGVADALDGLPLGRSDKDLTAELKNNPGSLKVDLSVAMPGELVETSGTSSKATPSGSRVNWSADLTAAGTETALSATSEETSGRAPQLVTVGGVLVLLAGAVLLISIWVSRRIGRQRG